ncbi:MAG: hypothetical protein OXG29_10985 [Gammaproteobacteria bacterium]|nr:hypothetical protein [Gammaproteobacteria bacterium]
MSLLWNALGAITFISAGIFVAVYFVYSAIKWLHDLITGNEYRAAKREHWRMMPIGAAECVTDSKRERRIKQS